MKEVLAAGAEMAVCVVDGEVAGVDRLSRAREDPLGPRPLLRRPRDRRDEALDRRGPRAHAVHGEHLPRARLRHVLARFGMPAAAGAQVLLPRGDGRSPRSTSTRRCPIRRTAPGETHPRRTARPRHGRQRHDRGAAPQPRGDLAPRGPRHRHQGRRARRDLTKERTVSLEGIEIVPTRGPHRDAARHRHRGRADRRRHRRRATWC